MKEATECPDATISKICMLKQIVWEIFEGKSQARQEFDLLFHHGYQRINVAQDESAAWISAAARDISVRIIVPMWTEFSFQWFKKC